MVYHFIAGTRYDIWCKVKSYFHIFDLIGKKLETKYTKYAHSVRASLRDPYSVMKCCISPFFSSLIWDKINKPTRLCRSSGNYFSLFSSLRYVQTAFLLITYRTLRLTFLLFYGRPSAIVSFTWNCRLYAKQRFCEFVARQKQQNIFDSYSFV